MTTSGRSSGKKNGAPKPSVRRSVRQVLRTASIDAPFTLVAGKALAIPYRELLEMSAHRSSDLVRLGFKAMAVKLLAADLGIDQSLLADALRIPRSTLTRKLSRDELLSPDDSCKVLAVARIIGEMDRILTESGDPERVKEQSMARWTGEWLMYPVGALGFQRPIDYLDNPFGQSIVRQLLGRIQAGSLA